MKFYELSSDQKKIFSREKASGKIFYSANSQQLNFSFLNSQSRLMTMVVPLVRFRMNCGMMAEIHLLRECACFNVRQSSNVATVLWSVLQVAITRLSPSSSSNSMRMFAPRIPQASLSDACSMSRVMRWRMSQGRRTSVALKCRCLASLSVAIKTFLTCSISFSFQCGKLWRKLNSSSSSTSSSTSRASTAISFLFLTFI